MNKYCYAVLALFAFFISFLILSCSGLTSQNLNSGNEADPYSINNGTISISGIYANEATLTWTKPSRNKSIEGLQYKIVRSLSPDINSLEDVNLNGTIVKDWTSNIAKSVVRGMKPLTNYYYNVVVKDENNVQSVYNMTNLATTAGPEPGSNGLLTIISKGSNSLELSWVKGTDSAFPQNTLKYRVFFSTLRSIESISEMEAYGTPACDFTTNISSLTINSLNEGNKYYLNVMIANNNDQKASYAQSSIIYDGISPDPGIISFSRILGTSMRVKWSGTTDNYSGPDKLQYRLVVSSTGNISNVDNALTNGTVLQDWQPGIYSYDVSGLSAYTTYYFNVLVKDEAGNIGAYGMVSRATAYADGNLLVNPSMEGGSQQGQSIPYWINSWVPTSAGYKTMWNYGSWPNHCHSGTFGVYMYTAGISGTTYCNISQLIPWVEGEPAKAYTWTRSGRGSGAYSQTTFIPVGYAYIKINFINSSNSIIGSYMKQVDNVQLYAAMVSHWDNNVLTLETPDAPSGTAFLQIYIGVYKPDTTDAYQLIFSFDDAYCGINSLSPSVPQAVSNLFAAGDDGAVELVWSVPNSGGSVITGYEIQYGTGGSFDHVYTDDAVPGAVINGLNNGQEYQFRVIAKNAKGNGVPSNIAAATPRDPLRQDVVWTDLTNTSAVGGTLTRTSGADVWDAGAVSDSAFSGDGGVEFEANVNTTYRMCGLSSTNADANYTSIQYALYPAADKCFYIYESGAYKGPFLVYKPNDHFSVERIGTNVIYKYNNRIFYISTTPTSNNLMVDSSIYTSGGVIQNAKIITR